MTRHVKRGGKVWIRVFPDKPVTQKPAETRMGSGKGNPELWVAVVHPGRVLFELAGVDEELVDETPEATEAEATEAPDATEAADGAAAADGTVTEAETETEEEVEAPPADLLPAPTEPDDLERQLTQDEEMERQNRHQHHEAPHFRKESD